jgi:hypothetical protein
MQWPTQQWLDDERATRSRPEPGQEPPPPPPPNNSLRVGSTAMRRRTPIFGRPETVTPWARSRRRRARRDHRPGGGSTLRGLCGGVRSHARLFHESPLTAHACCWTDSRKGPLPAGTRRVCHRDRNKRRTCKLLLFRPTRRSRIERPSLLERPPKKRVCTRGCQSEQLEKSACAHRCGSRDKVAGPDQEAAAAD